MESAYRISLFGDEVERSPTSTRSPARSHAASSTWRSSRRRSTSPRAETIERSLDEIRHELEEQVKLFESQGKLLEAHRIRQRTEYDMEMLRGARLLQRDRELLADPRRPASRDRRRTRSSTTSRTTSLVFVDESHQTVPQLGGMYEGDRSRKETLVEYGFRLPSALDNRPLRFDEFLEKVPQIVFVSATPGPFELRTRRTIARADHPADRASSTPRSSCGRRRTRSTTSSNEIRSREEAGERVLVTTLTKKMAEDLTDYLLESGVKARYLHSEIDTLERIQIIRELRLGEYDVLVGVNLLREGLDLPEVSLVAILDADKEGFLRGQTALIQTIGRAARNVNGKVRHVRGQAHRGDQGRHRRDEPPARHPAPLQRGARDHAGVDRQGRVRHRRVPRARVADASRAGAAAGAQGRGHAAGRDREARGLAGGGDVRGGRGAPLRVRGQAARRDQGAPPRAPGGEPEPPPETRPS